MRTIVFCVILLILLFAGHCAYDRITADRKLNQAVVQLPYNPLEAYRLIKEVLDYSSFVSLGKVGDVEQKFLGAVQKRAVEALSSPAPSPDIYPATEQSLGMLTEFSRQTGTNTTNLKNTLLKAARDSVPALREKGSLKAWDNMVAMFQNFSSTNVNMNAAFDDFGKWFDETKAVARRPFGLRDALNDSSEAFTRALEDLKVSTTSDKDHPLVAAPASLTDDQLIKAMKDFFQAQQAIDNFQSLFGETKIPTELRAMHAKIAFNQGAIKLAHFQDRKATIMQTGSDFMVEFQVRSDTSYVPTASEMVSKWQEVAASDFRIAQESFPQAASIDEPMRHALAAAAIWSEGNVWTAIMGGNSFEARSRATQMARGLSGPAGEVVHMFQSTPRAVLIVCVP